MIVTASIKNVPISPKKLGRVVDALKGHGAPKAIDEAKLIDKKGAFYIGKLIKSAMSNASHNFKLDASKLKITKLWCSDGIKSIRRARSASRGRFTMIQKYRSNLYIELSYGE